MKDKLIFKKTILKNGMVVYSQLDQSVDFALFQLVTPVGSVHSHTDIIPGTFHYLEHLMMKKSVLYPKIGSAKARARELGGDFGASTWFKMTNYFARVPSDSLLEIVDAVVSQFFEPLFNQEDVVKERGIIESERKRKGPYFPGDTQKKWYELTQWKDDCSFPVNQVFGSNEDFEMMDEKYFHDIHQRFYPTDKTYCIVAGDFDLETICKKLEDIPLKRNVTFPQESYRQLGWNRKDFHEFETPEVSRFEYLYRWIYPIEEKDEPFHFTMNQIIAPMLTDYSSAGTIMNWLRHEKGWLYETNSSFNTRKGVADSGLMIPLHSMIQVNTVRDELEGRIFDIMKNHVLLEKIKKQKLLAGVFQYQTPQERVDSVLSDLHWYGSIETMQDYSDALDRITTEVLQDLFINKIRPNIGELVLVPKN